MSKINHYTTLLIFVLILILFFGFTGYSQIITGKVQDKKGVAIADANINIYPTNYVTNTDKYGQFSIIIEANKPDGFFIEITHVSYQTKRIELADLTDFYSIEITLSDAAVDLEEVTLFQSRILQKAVDNSQSVVSIDEKFITKNSTGTFSGALAAVPGMNTMNVGVGIAKPIIRGMGFNRVLVNNRGIKQEGQQWGADHGLEIDPFDVEEVEIIKGPASLLFGSDGLGGVINIKENSPLAKNGNAISYRGSYQTNNSAISNSVEWKGRHDKWFYSTRVTHQDYGDYTVPSDQFTYAGFNLPIYDNRLKNTAGNELHFSGTVGYQSQYMKTSLRFTSFNQKAGIFTGAIGLPRAYNLQHNGAYRDIQVPRQENQHHMLISNTTIVLRTDRVEIDLGYQRNNREELSSPGAHGISPKLAGSNLALGLYLDTYTANLRYETNPNPKHQLLFGGQLQYMKNQKDGFEFLLPAFSSFQSGLFHYQLYDISTKWVLNGGIRYDIGGHAIKQHLQPIYDPGTLQPTGDFMERTPAFDREFDNMSGAIGVNYKMNSQNHLKFNLGNSFRFPTAIELSSNGVHHGNFRHEKGDQSLKVEKGYQGDITYLHESKNTFVEIAAFYGSYTDYIYLSPTGTFSPLASGGTLWQYQQNDALFNGFEITGSYRFPFDLKTMLAADFVQNLNLNSRLPLPLTPQPSTTLRIEYEKMKLVSEKFKEVYAFISGRYNFEQNRVDRNELSTPDSLILNIGMGFETKLFDQFIQFRISANNLLNTAYLNHISRYRLLNLPEQGRNLMFSVNIPITF